MGEYNNLAKDRPAWGLGLTAQEQILITDGNDVDQFLIIGDSGAGWTFLAVDLEVQCKIGYIRIFISLGTYIALKPAKQYQIMTQYTRPWIICASAGHQLHVEW